MNYFNIGICDDEKIILEKISQLINDKFKEINCDYDINKFHDPMELIEYHSQEYFNIIFLDIDMSKINGTEACEKLKKNKEITLLIDKKRDYIFIEVKIL